MHFLFFFFCWSFEYLLLLRRREEAPPEAEFYFLRLLLDPQLQTITLLLALQYLQADVLKFFVFNYFLSHFSISFLVGELVLVSHSCK